MRTILNGVDFDRDKAKKLCEVAQLNVTELYVTDSGQFFVYNNVNFDSADYIKLSKDEAYTFLTKGRFDKDIFDRNYKRVSICEQKYGFMTREEAFDILN